MSADAVGLALLLLGMVLLVAKVVRVRSRSVQRLFLPASIVGGFVALLLGPEVLGRVVSLFGSDALAEGGVFGADVQEVWSSLPGLLISVVFATLFLGKPVPSPVRAAKLVGPQLSVGVAYGSGQFVLGCLLALFVLVPVFGLPPMVAALLEISFEGGHGTAAGMAPVFDELGFSEATDLALGLATIGVVGGVVIGVALINWAVRTGRSSVISSLGDLSEEERSGLYAAQDSPSAGRLTTRPASIEPLALHFGFVALAIILGQVVLSGLQALEQVLWADSVEVLAFVPLFPLAMLGGVAVQVFLDRTGRGDLLDAGVMARVQGLSLDLLIVSALATLSLSAIADNIWPFLILAVSGVIFNLLVFALLVPRTIPQFWFERGIGDYGQSMGVTATGLILMRIADPETKTPAVEAFGYKQLLYEPFFGGGLLTAASVPLIFAFGLYPWLIAMSIVFVASVLLGLLYFGRRADRFQVESSAEEPASA